MPVRWQVPPPNYRWGRDGGGGGRDTHTHRVVVAPADAAEWSVVNPGWINGCRVKSRRCRDSGEGWEGGRWGRGGGSGCTPKPTKGKIVEKGDLDEKTSLEAAGKGLGMVGKWIAMVGKNARDGGKEAQK